MSEANAPHTLMGRNQRLTGETGNGIVEHEAKEREGQPAEMDKTETVAGSDMTFGFMLHSLREVHLDYFSRLIAWLKQHNTRTHGRGNAELLAQRMFSLIGTSREYHLKNATGMTMDEVRTHVYNLVDSLPDLQSSELTPALLWEHRTVLDELRPYLKHIKLQPRSAVKAFTWRGAVRKSWRWLATGY